MIEVGSIIKAYHKGYWKVTKVIERPPLAPVLEYTQVANGAGQMVNKPIHKSCDAGWCTLLDRQAIEGLHATMIRQADSLRDTLLKALD